MPISIGVSRGRLFCGSVGTMSRREYAVVGDSCNLAARLMKQAVTGSAAVDKATWQATCR